MSVNVAEEVRCALDAGQPVVALETAVLTSGLPRCTWNDSYGEPPNGVDVTAPINAATAMAMTEIIRSNDAIPAWIGVLNGELIVGLSLDEVLQLAGDEHATKVSIANCASTMMRGDSAGTTVAATGRTARAGRGGIAWMLVTPEQGQLLTQIETLTNVEIPLKEYPDFKPGPEPKEVAKRRSADEKRVEEARKDKSRTKLNVPSEQEGKDEQSFPGGIVPKGLPSNRMGGRIRTRRR